MKFSFSQYIFKPKKLKPISLIKLNLKKAKKVISFVYIINESNFNLIKYHASFQKQRSLQNKIVIDRRITKHVIRDTTTSKERENVMR